MIKLQRILFPTDFSELSAHALDYARSLAETYKAELHVLHVVDDAYQYWMPMAPGSIPIGPPIEDLIALADNELKKFKATHLANAPFSTFLASASGRPFMEIITYAKEKNIDLIVIGTHGRSGLRHALLGSVTEKVVRKAPCPVLTIRHPEHEFVMP
jgi:nucleotide-binding universal stress UspA family protein